MLIQKHARFITAGSHKLEVWTRHWCDPNQAWSTQYNGEQEKQQYMLPPRILLDPTAQDKK